MGRKKKLEKGIKSLEEQHKIHEEKLSQTKDENLKEYWVNEIRKFEQEIEKKKMIIFFPYVFVSPDNLLSIFYIRPLHKNPRN